MDTIFLITVIQKIQRSSNHIPDLGDTRCLGWYSNLDEAKFAVENNFNDMHEDLYEYAVIEEMNPGLKIPEKSRIFYQWKNNSYQEINIPNEVVILSNFGIG